MGINLVACRDCRQPVSRGAKTCPNCGARSPSTPAWTYYIAAGIVLVVVLPMLFRCSPSADYSPPAETTSAFVSPSIPTSTQAPRPLASDGEVRAHVRATIALWDDLQRCKANPDFRRAGFAAGGPCPAWIGRAQELHDAPINQQMITEGWECLPGDVMNAGTTLAMSGASRAEDREYVQWVRRKIETCRNRLSGAPETETSAPQATEPSTVAANQVVGIWCDMPGTSLHRTMTIASDAQGRLKLTETDQPLALRNGAYWVSDSDFGDRYRVRSDGDLQLTDNEGPIRIATRVGSASACN